MGLVPHFPATPVESHHNNHTMPSTRTHAGLAEVASPASQTDRSLTSHPSLGSKPTNGTGTQSSLFHTLSSLFHRAEAGSKRLPSSRTLVAPASFGIKSNCQAKLPHSSPDLSLGIILLLSLEFSSVALRWSQPTWGAGEGPLDPGGGAQVCGSLSSSRAQCGCQHPDFLLEISSHDTTLPLCQVLCQ